jgi:probable F420-dependent oxidoreductase
VKFWQSLSFAEPEQLVDIAQIAEEVGFHGVLMSDHLFFPKTLDSTYPYSDDGVPVFTAETPFPDALLTIAAMASVTRTLQFSTIVYILPLRHPLEVAKQCATLAILSGDRFALGVGSGWMKEEFETLEIDFKKRGRRYDEMLEIMRGLWDDGEIEYRGEHFDFDALAMQPQPVKPIPVYVGGASGPALRRAARTGDGWIGPGSTPEEVPALLARLDGFRVDYGRGDVDFENFVPLAAPPDVDLFKRMRDAGVDSTVSYPFNYALGPASSLDDKRRLLEQFAENFIRPLSS